MPSHSDVLRTLPPGPSLSVAQQTLLWLTKPFDFLRECARTLGDPFTLDFGRYGRYVLFSHPDAIRTIFLADATILQAGKGNSVLRPFLGPNSLLLLDGERHLEERRLLLPSFRGHGIFESGALIRDAAVEAVRGWTQGQTVVILEAMQRIALHVILRITFGPGDTERFDELKRHLQTFLNDPRLNLAVISQIRDDLGMHGAWKTVRKGFDRIENLLLSEVALRREESWRDRGDVFGMLLAARRDDGRPLDDVELRDELVTLLVTGYETTAATLAWAFYWLHRKPDVCDRLREDLAGVGSDPEPIALARLKYLEVICLETLRISPVIPLVAREVVHPLQIQGYDIPPGATVAACIYLTHYRDDIYSEPDEFRPERFLDREYSAYEFLPFGGGARRCLGMPLALYEMKIVLGTILQRYAFEALPGETVYPVRRSVAIAPSGGTRLRVVRAPGSE